MPYSRCTEHPPATACALGPLDVTHAPEDRRMLLASLDGRENLLIDMSGVTRMDSAGLANLVETCQVARMRGKGFALTRVNEPVMRMIKLARLDRTFRIVGQGAARPDGWASLA